MTATGFLLLAGLAMPSHQRRPAFAWRPSGRDPIRSQDIGRHLVSPHPDLLIGNHPASVDLPDDRPDRQLDGESEGFRQIVGEELDHGRTVERKENIRQDDIAQQWRSGHESNYGLWLRTIFRDV